MATLADLASRLKLTLVAISDERRGGDILRQARRLRPGTWLIFRHYGDPERSVLAARLAAICRARRIMLLVAADFPLARDLGTGLHLPDRLAAQAPAKVRLWKRKGGSLTAAAHDRRGLVRAARLGADAALLSPVFPTLSHPGTKPLGLLALRRLARRAKLPVVALGGIGRTTILQLRGAPIAGVAAVSALK